MGSFKRLKFGFSQDFYRLSWIFPDVIIVAQATNVK